MLCDNATLIKMYLEYNTPADRLVSDPSLLLKFTADYGTRTGKKVPASQLGQTLLNLRKRGEDNGGLPRLRRTYNGRSNGFKQIA